MSAWTYAVLVATMSTAGMTQRGSYAGRRPVGYPMITTSTTPAPLGNRFGEDVSTTTVRLPVEALGDRELVDRLSKLPADKQPFWLLNWQALEANRNNPQSYQPNPNSFIDPFVSRHPPTDSPTGFTQDSRINPNFAAFINTQPRSGGEPSSNLEFTRGVNQETNSRFAAPTFYPEDTSANFRSNRDFNSARNWQWH